MAASYHTALKSGAVHDAEPLQRFELGGSRAFVHDVISGPLPPAYDDCDVLYADIPWRSGMAAFASRAGLDEQPFDAFMRAVRQIVVSRPGIAVVLVGGQQHRRYLPPSHVEVWGKLLHGAPTVAYTRNIDIRLPTTSALDILEALAARYNHVGDFCCGYGTSGRIFARAGKRFTLSDFNARCIGYIAKHAADWKAS